MTCLREWRPLWAPVIKKQDFDEIDADGDGFITASELLAASVKENPKISDNGIIAIVMMADDDGGQEDLLRRIREVCEVGRIVWRGMGSLSESV